MSDTAARARTHRHRSCAQAERSCCPQALVLDVFLHVNSCHVFCLCSGSSPGSRRGVKTAGPTRRGTAWTARHGTAQGTAQGTALHTHDMTWYGMMWHDMAWCDMTWRDLTWRDVTWRGMTWHDVTWRDVTWRGVAWRDVTWCDIWWHDETWCDVLWRATTWHGVAWRSVDYAFHRITLKYVILH